MDIDVRFVKTFQNFESAQEILLKMIKNADRYGATSYGYFLAITGIDDNYSPRNCQYGWSYKPLFETGIERLNGKEWFINLPRPVKIYWNSKNQKYIFKEENTMGGNANNNIFYADANGKYVPLSKIPDVTNVINVQSPEDIEYEKKCKELRDEAEKKILDIRKELATALQKLDQARKDTERIAIEKKRAEIWKQKYDAFVEAGFSEEQAWEMMMESYKCD